MMMKTMILGLLTLAALLSCDDATENQVTPTEPNFLIFGHFYGECIGEQCVETFKLTDQSLFEDTVDDYSGANLNFIALKSEKFDLVKDLRDFFPNQLLMESQTVLGCPDCADGGGLFIQHSENGTVKSWRIDQDKRNVSEYLYDFMDKVNEKITLINS